MKAAIPKLMRRVGELEAINIETLQERGEPRFEALEQKIDSTLVDIFGRDMVEIKRYYIRYAGPINILCISRRSPLFNFSKETP